MVSYRRGRSESFNLRSSQFTHLNMEPKQAIGYQIELFMEQRMDAILSSESRKDVNRTTTGKDWQVTGKRKTGRALAGNLLKAVCSGENLQARLWASEEEQRSGRY